MYLDAVFAGVRDGTQVKKLAFYVALGMVLDSRRDSLGLWVAETEGASAAVPIGFNNDRE